MIICCQLGGYAILRSLGPYGIDLYAVEADPDSPALRSRYCKQSYIQQFNRNAPEDYLALLLRIARDIGRKAILIPTSDELSIFVARNREALREHFIFPYNSGDLVHGLADKRRMYELALEHQVPVPTTLFPQNVEDVIAALDDLRFPVMLKGIRGDRMQERTGERMVPVAAREDLVSEYEKYEDPEVPNLMLQEMIPGDDDQVYIFNGYFNAQSKCLAGYTGHKLRQFPVHKGCASLGECRTNQTVADQTIRLMQAVGYQGILDIGYRLDPRDGQYKVLDINPRLGQAMRIFVAENGMDVARALYLDLTGQAVPESPAIEGRRWVIEDFDLVSSLNYYKEGTLDVLKWVKSYGTVQETAWMNPADPLPGLVCGQRFAKKMALWMLKSVRGTA
ncbi:MAG: hypothetical protein SFV15_24270 [Polyangiaceae bacterium]|nr:hypothetical protein [Polyangiaceae bacterium]